MKKILALLLVLAMTLSMAACGGKTETPTEAAPEAPATEAPAAEATEAPEAPAAEVDYRVAMVTDSGDITDQSFNQTTWEAVTKFGEDNGVDYKYYKPTTADDAGRAASMELAIADGYNVIVLPGFLFAAAIVEVAPNYPDVKFIALDVAEGDLLGAAVAAKGETYDYNPANWNMADYLDMSNIYCAIYQEELSGYMAGYAAVKLGYTELGFLGGMAVPAVQRFGHGYVQGAGAAAKELGVAVNVKYAYGNQFFGDADITAVMDTWYAAGTQVVFACGGGIYTSAGEAAQKVGGKLIGVDTDQSAVIDGLYGEGITITSAMKGLFPTTVDTLTDVILNNNWANYSGKIANLGLVNGEDPAANYVQLAPTTQFEEGKFTEADYAALVKGMFDGTITVSNDTSAIPTVEGVTVQDFGNLK
ncbi:MAG: BMP family ABC transporter substrate-binding protein [Eubacteriales bacterium]|nr:BMP family ABC transporter substrate-binding protein [Eubacteriales bacterium]